MTWVKSQTTVPNNLAVLKIQNSKVLGSGIKIFRKIFWSPKLVKWSPSQCSWILGFPLLSTHFQWFRVTDLSLTKMYCLLGRKSKLSTYNKLLVYKAILKPIWTYGIQLWGTTSNSNIKILERFPSVSEPLTYRGVLMSTLLQAILNTFPPFAEYIITDCK
jgi:hypothetical protein